MGLNSLPYHNNFYRNWNWELGFVLVIQLLYNKNHQHDHNGHDQVTDVGLGDLAKDFLKGLCKRNTCLDYGDFGNEKVNKFYIASGTSLLFFLRIYFKC